VRIESQIEADVAKHSEQRLYPLDFNMKLAMDVCVNQNDTIELYLKHIHTNSRDLSGENLYKRMVKCVKVTTDDSDSNGLKGDQDMNNDDSNVADREVLVLNSKDKQSVLTPEILARKWGIGLDAAEQTLNVTTHRGMLGSNMPHDRKVRQCFNHLKYLTISSMWYTDTTFALVKSIQGMKCSQVWTNGLGYKLFHLLAAKRDVHLSLSKFIQDVGIPNLVISDDSNAQVAGEFGKLASRYHIKRMLTMPYSPWHNCAKASIKELKKAMICLMRKHHAPRRTWCYAGEAASQIMRLTASNLCRGRTPEEAVTGNTPDISEDSQFEFYEVVRYHDLAEFSDDRKQLGRCLGVADNYTSNMAYCILKKNGQVIVRKLVWPLQQTDLDNIKIQANIAELDQGIHEKIGGKALAETDILFPDVPIDFFGLDEEDGPTDNPQEPDASKPDVDNFTDLEVDEYLSAVVDMPRNGDLITGCVSQSLHDTDRKLKGKRHLNPLLDTCKYEVEFPEVSRYIYGEPDCGKPVCSG
jgi:hypothetical protein